MVNFKETIIFPGSRGGPTLSGGGGGVQLLIVPPLDPHLSLYVQFF